MIKKIISILHFIVIPVIAIWAFNTLWPSVSIPLTIETWIAGAILFNRHAIERLIKFKND